MNVDKKIDGRQAIEQYKKTRLFRACMLFLAISAVPVVFLLLVAFAFPHQSFFAGVWKNSTTRTVEPFTELYFADPKKLPTTYRAGEPLPIAFTVHNQEHQDKNYRYEVKTSEQVTPVKNSVYLKHGEIQTITAPVAIVSAEPRVKITIELIDQNQTIHVWVELAP